MTPIMTNYEKVLGVPFWLSPSASLSWDPNHTPTDLDIPALRFLLPSLPSWAALYVIVLQAFCEENYNTMLSNVVGIGDFQPLLGVRRRGEIGKGCDCDTRCGGHIWSMFGTSLHTNYLQTNCIALETAEKKVIVFRPLQTIASHELLHELLRQQIKES